MKKVGIIISVIVIVIAALIFFLSQREKPSQVEVQPEKITIGMVTFPGYAPLYLAQAKGLFPGLDVELRRIESIGDLRAAFKSGQIDIYAATYDIFQSAKGVEPPGIGFLAIDESHGGDGVVVSSGIESIEDFRGKTVGAEPGFPPYFILQYLLDNAGMTLKDVSFKDMASQDAGNAFVVNQLDIAGTYEPYLSISAEKRDGAKVLYSSKDVPGLVVDWLFAQEDLVKNKPEVLEAICKGWFSALEFIDKNSDESYTIMGESFGVPKEEMIDFKTGISWLTLLDNKKMFESNSPSHAPTVFNKVGDILEKNNETDIRVKAENHLTSSILSRLQLQ